MQRKALLLDMDGTLCNTENRLPLILEKPKNWREFYKKQILDLPNYEVLEYVWKYKDINPDHLLIICTGRPITYYDDTVIWAHKYNILVHKTYMRAKNDFRKDFVVKPEIVDNIIADGYDPQLILEDRDEIVAIYREKGLKVKHVVNGRFSNDT